MEHRAAVALWQLRDFRLVWAGGLVNDLGDWLLIVALPVYVYTETGSGLATGLLFLVEMAPAILLGSLAGAFVDRWDLRRTLVATNLAQAIALLPLLVVTPDRIWPAFVVAGVQSVLARVNNPAKGALLPRLVPPQQLAAANAAGAVSDQLARLAGSPLGGIVVQLSGLPGVVLVDGLSFLVVAALMTGVDAGAGRPLRSGSDGGSPAPHPVRDLRDGLAVVRRTRPLPALVTTMLLSQVAQGLFLVLFLVFVVRRLDGDGAAVGLLRGVQAVGGVLGGVVIGRLARGAAPGRVAGFGFVAFGVVAAMTWHAPAVTTALPVYVALFVAAGVPAVACHVGMLTAAQRLTPPAYLGRLLGSMEAAAGLGAAAGTVLAGVLVDRVAITRLLDAQAALYLLCGAICLTAVAGAPTPEPSTAVLVEGRW